MNRSCVPRAERDSSRLSDEPAGAGVRRMVYAVAYADREANRSRAQGQISLFEGGSGKVKTSVSSLACSSGSKVLNVSE